MMTMRAQRVLLRGFRGDEERQAAQVLTDAGHTLAQTLSGADLVVLGSEGADKVLALARERQLSVVTWAELQQRLSPEKESKTVRHLRRLAVESSPDRIRVLDIELPRRGDAGGLVPSAERFASICLDTPFLQAARAVALGVSHRLPTSLEGNTAASKTTVVLWLAHLLGQPVQRLNLNGQTDTGELVGRYVPARNGDDWDVAALSGLGTRLQPVTRELLALAAAEQRPLNWAERALIAGTERLPDQRWRFQEGVIPTALRQGHWVLLDELNLAEPQVLERLNPVLEMPPSLLLSEGDHTAWGPGGLPVHSEFRILATMNPAEYAGRSVMSPAFRDRWVNWYHAGTPGEAEFLAQLRFLAHGEHPEVIHGDWIYQGAPSAPVLPELGEMPGNEELLAAMSRFHASMAVAGAEGGRGPALGRSRRERYVFTRRSLEASMRIWASLRRESPSACPKAQLSEVLATFYWHRLGSAADRKAAQGLAQASGLPVGRDA
jgi:MoxR-like ATPase